MLSFNASYTNACSEEIQETVNMPSSTECKQLSAYSATGQLPGCCQNQLLVCAGRKDGGLFAPYLRKHDRQGSDAWQSCI